MNDHDKIIEDVMNDLYSWLEKKTYNGKMQIISSLVRALSGRGLYTSTKKSCKTQSTRIDE